MIAVSAFSLRRAVQALTGMLLALPLAACLQGAGSKRGFDFTASTPTLPFRSNGFDLLSRSEDASVNQMASIITQMITVRVEPDGHHAVVMRSSAGGANAGPGERVMPVRYFALPGSPSVFAVRFNAARPAQQGATATAEAQAFVYVFIEKTADIVQILPLTQASLTAWRPDTDADRRLRDEAIALPTEGANRETIIVVENAAQLELALRAASRLPTRLRATLRIRDAAAAPQPQAGTPAPAATAVATRWQFGEARDPVTRVVTQYANLRANAGSGGGPDRFQMRCSGPRLEFLFENGRSPLRNELQSGRLRAALMEINIDDRVVHRLMWLISDRQPQLAFDPRDMGGLVAVAGMLNIEVQRSVTNWSAVWLLNTMASANSVVLRVWDSAHNAHVLRFSPRVSLADVRRRLSDCVK